MSKKDTSKKEIQIADNNSLFVKTYNAEVTQERVKALKEALSKFNKPEEKMDFLRQERWDYLSKVSPEVLMSSGIVTAGSPFTPGTPIFFDRIIEIEMNKIKEDNPSLYTRGKHRVFSLEQNESHFPIDPLTLIDPIFMPLFLAAEKKAGEFKTNIRCAAFCELLYKNKYIIEHKHHIKRIELFAKCRYNIDISLAMKPKQIRSRHSHVERKVKGQPPLKYCF